ncbi:hypothetical protein I314_03540 [Cryptococcus bacillisporus CA1873]|uniref:Uncharacterized protein n=1 Tax=Cryptococcus bacillisporus CA1873 TaxID=1296111 RepID=A0ABR5BB46_CRYGA|nr:hypothetical protein I314_03540 [Cryptococcus bacillisporus CA1873]|eukprot:KIR62594.1 hypothetical protein I314_03540 [Cryptococcus gattii CA1873]
MENSWVTLAALCILVQLSVQRKVLRTVWLLLNVIDTFRALRLVRANGRRIGVNTRRKSMRDALVCWIIYLIGTTLSPLISTLLGWIPLYSPIKSVLGCFFLILRLPCSMTIFKSLVPLVKPYETPVDITFHLFESLSILIFHFGVQLPIVHATTWIKSVGKVDFKRPVEILQRWKRKLLISLRMVSLPKAVRTRSNPKNTPSQIIILPTPPRSVPSSPAARQTSAVRPTTRPRQPRQSKRKPLQPIIISPSPSPPPSPPPAPMLVIAPSTPVRRMTVEELAAIRKNGFLDVEREVEVRRSPRKNKGKRKDDEAANEMEAQRELKKATEIEDGSQRLKSKKRVREDDEQSQPHLAKSIAASRTMNGPGVNKRPVRGAEVQPSKLRVKESVSGLKGGAIMSNVSNLRAGKDIQYSGIIAREPKHPHILPSRLAASLPEQHASSKATMPGFTDKAASLQQSTSIPIAPTPRRKPQTLAIISATRRVQKSAPDGVAEPEKPLISAAGRARAAKAKAKALMQEEHRKRAGEKRKAAGEGQNELAEKRTRMM